MPLFAFLCIAALAHAAPPEPATGNGAVQTASRELSPSGKPLTQEERATLERGEVLVLLTEVSGSPVKKATAVTLVDAPAENVFAILLDYNSFPEYMPYCKKVELEKKEGERSWVKFELDFPWPIGDRHYVLIMSSDREGGAFASSWTYEKDSGNINDTYGSWEVLPYKGGKSFVRYTCFTDPGGNIPGWANNMATEVAVPNVIAGLRKRVSEKAKEASASPSRN